MLKSGILGNIFLALLIIVVSCGSPSKRPRFDDYKVTKTYKGPLAEINTSDTIIPLSMKSNGGFRAIIKESYKTTGVNFAGHYSFLSFSCGSPCYSSFIIDAENGNVYKGPDSGMRFKFTISSSLIIAGDEENQKDSCAWCRTEYFVFENNELRIIK